MLVKLRRVKASLNSRIPSVHSTVHAVTDGVFRTVFRKTVLSLLGEYFTVVPECLKTFNLVSYLRTSFPTSLNCSMALSVY